MKWTGYGARIGEMRNAYEVLIGKPDRKTLLGRPMCR
jgi:hypothetical protein